MIDHTGMKVAGIRTKDTIMGPPYNAEHRSHLTKDGIKTFCGRDVTYTNPDPQTIMMQYTSCRTCLHAVGAPWNPWDRQTWFITNGYVTNGYVRKVDRAS